MARRIRAPGAKPPDLNSILHTHIQRTDLYVLSSNLRTQATHIIKTANQQNQPCPQISRAFLRQNSTCKTKQVKVKKKKKVEPHPHLSTFSRKIKKSQTSAKTIIKQKLLEYFKKNHIPWEEKSFLQLTF